MVGTAATAAEGPPQELALMVVAAAPAGPGAQRVARPSGMRCRWCSRAVVVGEREVVVSPPLEQRRPLAAAEAEPGEAPVPVR